MSGISADRRARRSFWILVVVAALATGVLGRAIIAPPSPFAGLRVAISGLILAASLSLAVRVMLAIDRARPRTEHRTFPLGRRRRTHGPVA
jgi:hypothetical protein